MSGPDATVRDALTELLARHPYAVVTDPNRIGALLRDRLREGPPVDQAIVEAVVIAMQTPVIRNLQNDARAEATDAQLSTELRRLGVPERVAADAARALVWALLPDAAMPAGPHHEIVPARPAPPRSSPPPAPPAPPPLPRFAPTAPAMADQTRSAAPPTVRGPRGQVVAGIIGGHQPSPPSHRTSGMARILIGLLAVVAVAASVLAFAGWTRDPSKSRATDAEATAATLTDTLSTTEQSLADAKSTVAERDAQLAASKAQITAMSSLTRAQYNSAQFPDQFTLTGRVAPGSCSLTGEACTVAATLRAVKLTCSTKPCDCTAVACTVTSELWKAASAVKYDPATNLFTAKGLLDGDVFRCAGIAQPTTYEFRFRVAKITFADGAWKASGIDAELAEASSAGGECLAGNRTYALGGPAA